MAKKKAKNNNSSVNRESNGSRYDAPPPAPPAADLMEGAISDDPLGERIQPGDYFVTMWV
jgi:hypothetical protein